MNKRFKITTNPILSDIIDHIDTVLDCNRFKECKDLIDIDTWENIQHKMPRNKNVAESGFGFCISNYLELGHFKRIIIVNMDNCKLAKFSQREITAIIYHELGHLLNEPELTEVPTIMNWFLNGVKYSKSIAEEVRNNNLLKMEIFADSYANQHGFGDELISTFQKQNQYFDQKIGYLNERIEALNNNEVLIGAIAPINTKGW